MINASFDQSTLTISGLTRDDVTGLFSRAMRSEVTRSRTVIVLSAPRYCSCEAASELEMSRKKATATVVTRAVWAMAILLLEEETRAVCFCGGTPLGRYRASI